MRPSLTFWILLAILAIVVFFAITPRFGSHNHFRPAPLADINGLFKSALGQYQVDTGSYPKSLQDLFQKPDDVRNWHGPYFDPPVLPVDPWGHKYFYEHPGKHNTNDYDLFSAGPDGKAGTADDIINWNQ